MEFSPVRSSCYDQSVSLYSTKIVKVALLLKSVLNRPCIFHSVMKLVRDESDRTLLSAY